MLPRTEVSLRLNRTEVTVSAAVGKVRFEMAAVLKNQSRHVYQILSEHFDNGSTNLVSSHT